MTGQSPRGSALSRRTFLCIAAASACAVPARASGRELLVALDRMGGIGPRTARLRILVSPGCMRGEETFAEVEARIPAQDVRWIPFGWIEAEDGVVARTIVEGHGALSRFLSGDLEPIGATSIGRVQRSIFETDVFMPLVHATGRSPASPTLVLERPGTGPKVVRGSPPVEMIDAITVRLALGGLLRD